MHKVATGVAQASGVFLTANLARERLSVEDGPRSYRSTIEPESI
jgi:hypothetical protein